MAAARLRQPPVSMAVGQNCRFASLHISQPSVLLTRSARHMWCRYEQRLLACVRYRILARFANICGRRRRRSTAHYFHGHFASGSRRVGAGGTAAFDLLAERGVGRPTYVQYRVIYASCQIVSSDLTSDTQLEPSCRWYCINRARNAPTSFLHATLRFTCWASSRSTTNAPDDRPR
jgi:hypothetical protein